MADEDPIDVLVEMLERATASAPAQAAEDAEVSVAKDRQGVTLSRATPADRWRTCLHESAHGAIAVQWGLEVMRAVVRPDATGRVECRAREGSDEADVVMARIVACLAAPIFELDGDDIDDVQRLAHIACSSDLLQARLEIERYRHEFAPELQLSIRSFVALARASVRMHTRAIRTIAYVLYEHGAADAATILALCGAAH
jgi:hypothetical protein